MPLMSEWPQYWKQKHVLYKNCQTSASLARIRESVLNKRTCRAQLRFTGRSLTATLEHALEVLRSNNVRVDTSAQHTARDGRITTTILLSYLDDKPRALQLLIKAGIDVS